MRIVRETGKLIAQVARDLGNHEGTLGNWVTRDRVERGEQREITVPGKGGQVRIVRIGPEAAWRSFGFDDFGI